MPTPRISVAMSVYNGERFLAEAIESILTQSFADFEFLILDDGSRDSSRAIIERYAAQDSRIRPIIRENRGLIASLNQLIDAARAPVIARMDADDISLPQRFARQIAFLDAHPDYGVIGAWAEDIDERGHLIAHASPQYPTTHAAFLAAIHADQQLLCHPAVMMRRDVVVKAGGYHAAFRHCEDLDLWLRLASRTHICSLPEPLLRYRRYADQVSKRHGVDQQIGAAVARIAYRERAAGRSDPTALWHELPPIDAMDELFGREGIAREIRSMIAIALLYSRDGLRGSGFDMLLCHLRDGGTHRNMWRTVARLIYFGAPLRAIRLAGRLLSTRPAADTSQTTAA